MCIFFPSPYLLLFSKYRAGNVELKLSTLSAIILIIDMLLHANVQRRVHLHSAISLGSAYLRIPEIKEAEKELSEVAELKLCILRTVSAE